MMFLSKAILAVLGSAVAVKCVSVGHAHIHMHQLQHLQQRTPSRVVAHEAANPTCLDPTVLSTGSALTGQENGTLGIAAGQAPSETDPDNFISFCKGQTITNGLQDVNGSCNPIPMGKIPAKTNMVSSIITHPTPGQELPANVTFNVTVQLSNFELGLFTNPTTTYYAAPQDLNDDGNVKGHCHVTIQDLGGSFAPTTPPDAAKFAFFLGINDAGNGEGGLSATVVGGLAPGFYRVCTINSAANHQPVAMPVAKRGAQDDCSKFRVVADEKGAAVVSAPGTSNEASSINVGKGAANSAVTESSKARKTVRVSTVTRVKTTQLRGKVTTITDFVTTTVTDTIAAATPAAVAVKGDSGSNGGSGSRSGSGSKSGNGKKPGNGGGNKVIVKTVTKVKTSSVAGKVTTITVLATTTVTDTVAAIPTDVAIATGSESVCPSQTTSTITVTPSAAVAASAPVLGTGVVTTLAAVATGSSDTSGPGPALLPVTNSGDSDRPFEVNGNTFINESAAKQRSCDIQFNACANAVNSGVFSGPLSKCTTQKTACK